MSSSIKLLEATSPRVFLRNALEAKHYAKGRINISSFSRAAGFTSRSFISEYLVGRKNLSLESLRKIKSALKLSRDYAYFFSLLVIVEQPELSKEKQEDNLKELNELREKLRNKEDSISKIVSPKKIIGKRNLFKVFAGLGSENEGASLKEIVQRTNLNLDIVKESLDTLLRYNAIYFHDHRFFACSSQVDFMKMEGPELAHLTKEVCTEIRAQTDSLLKSENNLVFYSAFSVQSQQLPIFKEKLREAVLSVLDQFQNDNGDSVQQVFLCSQK